MIKTYYQYIKENYSEDIKTQLLSHLLESKEDIEKKGFHFEDIKTISPIKVEDKTANEKVHLISQLDEEDKNAVYRIKDVMLTKNKFQTYFEQKMAVK